MSVRATIQDETSQIHENIKEKAPTHDVLSECLRQWGTEDEVQEGPSWQDKPLHGMYHRNITEVADIRKTYQWIERAGLKDSTEAHHGSTGTGLEHQSNRGPDLPHQTRPKV